MLLYSFMLLGLIGEKNWHGLQTFNFELLHRIDLGVIQWLENNLR